MTDAQRQAVREAAERLRKLWEGGTLDSAYGVNLSVEGQRSYVSFDMETLARQYLAEHPADDESAVTEEWLREAGWIDPPASWSHPLNETVVVRFGWQGPCTGDDTVILYHGPMFVAHSPTRGRVRKLCAALGIALSTEEKPS